MKECEKLSSLIKTLAALLGAQVEFSGKNNVIKEVGVKRSGG